MYMMTIVVYIVSILDIVNYVMNNEALFVLSRVDMLNSITIRRKITLIIEKLM